MKFFFSSYSSSGRRGHAWRRRGLAALAALAVLVLALPGPLRGAFAQHIPLPSLPYGYADLEPLIDEQTMRLHHLKHMDAYLGKLNTALEQLRANPDTKPLAKQGVDKLLQHLDQIEDEGLRAAVRNNGGGFVNHELYFATMAPPTIKDDDSDDAGTAIIREPAGPLAIAIHRDFGSFAAFRETFTRVASSVFGSGWAWLYVNEAGLLQITSTPNQDTPAQQQGNTVLLGLDVWEHASYLKYFNRRNDYIDAWWRVVNWTAVEKRYNLAVAGLHDEL